MSDDIDDHEDNSDNIINADDFGGIYITPEDMNPFDGREFYFQDVEGENERFNLDGLDNQEQGGTGSEPCRPRRAKQASLHLLLSPSRLRITGARLDEPRKPVLCHVQLRLRRNSAGICRP